VIIVLDGFVFEIIARPDNNANTGRKQLQTDIVPPLRATGLITKNLPAKWIMNEITYRRYTEQVTWLVVTEVRNVLLGLVTERRHYNGVLCAVSHVCLLEVVYCYAPHIFIVECCIPRFLCAMHVFEVWTSSPPRLPLCKISFLPRPPLLSQPMEKIAYWMSRLVTLTHPAYLMPVNRSFRFGK